MATQILGTNHAALFPSRTEVHLDAVYDAGYEAHEESGSAFRGLFFVMVFNVMLVLTGAAGWELWRLIR